MLRTPKLVSWNLNSQRANTITRTRVSRRFNSSSTKQQASETAQNAYSTAQKQAEKALEGAKQVGQSVGGRIGKMMGSYREPLMYDLAVARELLKQIYVAEKLAPPTSFAEIRSAYSTIFERARHVSFWRDMLQTGEWIKLGIYGLEAYGIYKIGEMIGRRSIVGYKLE